jgi:chromosome partitioning protein
MKTISIVNRKGGVGKTTVALNIAYEMSRKGLNVLALDLDDQCDLTKCLLEKVEEQGIVDVLENRIAAQDALYTTYENLDCLPGSRDIVHLDNEGSNMTVQEILDSLSDEYDFVIIDQPPNLNEASLQGLIASDEVVIVTDVETFSMDNLDDLMEDLVSVKSELNQKLRIAGIIVNKVDLRRNLTKKKLAELNDVLGDYLFEATISNDTAVPTSHDAKVPVRQLWWRSRVVSQFAAITEELLERIGGHCEHE